ncbi:unnamed protein product [Leuciscus chuanchicus]
MCNSSELSETRAGGSRAVCVGPEIRGLDEMVRTGRTRGTFKPNQRLMTKDIVSVRPAVSGVHSSRVKPAPLMNPDTELRPEAFTIPCLSSVQPTQFTQMLLGERLARLPTGGPRPEGLPLSPSQAPILPVSSELLMGQVGNGDPPPLLGVMNTTQLDGNCSG